MDSKLFRLPQTPNYYAAQTSAAPWKESVLRSRAGAPAEDARFPGWAAPMSDGRLVTDYRPHCETNIPVAAQQNTRIWIQQNTDEIIRVSRDRMSELTGMANAVDSSIVPPPAVVVKCSTAGCEMKQTGAELGIGVERADATAPLLFGTWQVQNLEPATAPHVSLTRKYEGGRNTPRN